MLKLYIFLIFLCSTLNFCSSFVKNTPNLNIIIIGAGPSGLVSAKYAIEQGFNVTVYEQNEVLGGAWWYTDEIGKNKYGIDIHTSMYKGLRTNVPYQMMEYSDHVHSGTTIPFPSRKVIWNYLNSYAIRFGLKQHVKFTHLVSSVHPIENGRWQVDVKDLSNNKLESTVCDAVFICNGHNSVPKIPVIEGAANFKGKMLHSHDFRNAEAFSDENVLVIGSGSSGIDLVALLSATAKRVTWSRRSSVKSYPYKNITYKEEVKRFTAAGAEFEDGSEQPFSVIFYATGYNFSFPFLTKESGIIVADNNVFPLYKRIFNIEHPTMVFIGNAYGLHPTFPTIELQARFALHYLSGENMLPPKDEMLKDLQIQMEIHFNQYKTNSSQFLELEHRYYFNQLSNLTKIESPPEVISSIYMDNDAMRKGDPTTFRKYKYIIIDDIRYIKKKYEN